MANSKQPLVSIVTITYNHDKYLRQTLDSLFTQQTKFDFEVIVADDCSTDTTSRIIEEYTAKYPDQMVPIIRSKNIGAVPNMIDVMRTARGRYIAVCEGDDYWTDPKKLQIQVDYMEQHQDCMVCFHRANVTFDDQKGGDYVYPDVADLAWYTNEELLKINYVATNSVMYRRQAYDNLPTGILPFDWYLHLYHAQFGTIHLIDSVMSTYRKHEGGMWWEYDQNRDEIWKKHGLAYLGFRDALLKLYKDNEAYAAIISSSIYDLLDIFVGVDSKHGTKLYAQTTEKFPAYNEPFVALQHSNLHQKQLEASDLTTQLLAVGDERHDLAIKLDEAKLEIAGLQKELQAITTTKTWRLRRKLDRLPKPSRRGGPR